MTIVKEDRIQVNYSDELIVSVEACPMRNDEFKRELLLEREDGSFTPCCAVEDHRCGSFYRAELINGQHFIQCGRLSKFPKDKNVPVPAKIIKDK